MIMLKVSSWLPYPVLSLLRYIDGFTLNKHYMLFLTVAMAALYLKKELIATFTPLLNIILIITYFINPTGMLGTNDKSVGIKCSH